MTKKTIKNKLDKVFSLLIRSRGACEWCGKKDNLQTAHIYSRIKLSVRWDTSNALCLCAGCHFKGHQNPIEFTNFVISHLGKDRQNKLTKEATRLKKWQLYELEGLLSTLEGEWKKLKDA